MTNLLIGYSQLQSAATRMIAAPNFSTAANENEFYPIRNSTRGWRNQFYKPASASSSIYLTWDLGGEAWSATPSEESQITCAIISRLDTVRSLASTIELKIQSSNDEFATSTDVLTVADIDSPTLYGPKSNDWISIFSQSAAARYYRLKLTKTAGADIAPPLGKVFFGNLLDLGVDPDYRFTREPRRQPAFADSGSVELARVENPLYQFHFTWDNVTDTQAFKFMDRIGSKLLDQSFFLYTSSFHDVLDGHRLMHVRCLQAETLNQNEKYNSNTVSAIFEELPG